MQGLVKEGMAGGELTEVAQVHDHDTVAEVLDHAQVVGDEEVGQTLLVPELVQELEDLCLHRYVQGRDRLVQHHELGVQGDGTGNAHTLLLTARELMGIGVILFGLEAHPVQQFQGLFLFELGAVVGVDVKDLLNGLADGLPGVEAGSRVLEDHLHIPAQRPQLGRGELAQVDAGFIVAVQLVPV